MMTMIQDMLVSISFMVWWLQQPAIMSTTTYTFDGPPNNKDQTQN
jgi:hypothetical protein